MNDNSLDYFLESLVVGDLQMNCYIFGCAATRQAVIIDPGGDAEQIISAVAEVGATIKMILLTHGHYDHIAGLREVKQHFNCPVLIHVADEEALTNPMVNLSALTGANITCEPAEQILDDGDQVAVGNLRLEVIHTPGHTPGGVCFRYGKVVFGGDVLFQGSIGRTDLPGGSFEDLERSIISRLYVLPDDTTIYPGHGEPTTIGFEKKHNPFVRQSA